MSDEGRMPFLARKITGYEPQEFDPALWNSITLERVLLEDLAEYSFEDAIEHVRSGDKPIWKCEHRIRARDGTIHWVFEVAVELRDENGVAHGSIGLYQDITERKQAEIEREKLITELSAKNAELERFTYTVSHDVKSPIVTIRGFLGYLTEDALSGNTTRMENDIQRITSATDKMQSLLRDLLELSRIGRMMNAPETIRFEDLLRDAFAVVATGKPPMPRSRVPEASSRSGSFIRQKKSKGRQHPERRLGPLEQDHDRVRRV